MSYDGPERRHEDKLALQLIQDLSELRGEVRAERRSAVDAIEKLASSLDDRIAKLEKQQTDFVRLVERGRVVVWVLGVLGGVLTTLEAKWGLVTKAFKGMMS